MHSSLLRFSSQFQNRSLDPDRIGILASVLCAIHCAIAPVLLIFAPTFGRWWAHPASHWLIALFVVPLAIVMIARGFRKHRRRWVATSGSIGIALVVAGAVVPYVGQAKTIEGKASQSEAAPTNAAEEWPPGEEKSETGCEDGCCPSLVTDEQNQSRLHIPPASIVTTLGGLALILAHVGNVCLCSTCRTSEQT